MKYDCIPWIQDLVKCLSRVEVSVFSGTSQTIQALHQRLPVDLALPMLDSAIEEELQKLRPGCIYEVTAIFRLHFIVVHDPSDLSYLIVGPCLLDKPIQADVSAQLRKIGGTNLSVPKVLQYLENTPQISYEVFHQLGNILVNALLDANTGIPYQRIDYHWDFLQKQAPLFTDHYAEASQIRMVELRYETSAALTEAVKCGNLSLAYRFLKELDSEGSVLIRNPDPLRNRKNMCIVLNTQLRHALEDTGIHPFLLDQISTDIAVRIEQLRSLNESNRLVADVIRQYCELSQNHAFPDLKPMIHFAVTYVKSHLNENLTVKQVAKALLINPDYLSHRFHKEMGIGFIDFINQERTKQAAYLLIHSSLQIQQISSIVGYNNTSYFSKQFSRYYHMTPNHYRASGLH